MRYHNKLKKRQTQNSSFARGQSNVRGRSGASPAGLGNQALQRLLMFGPGPQIQRQPAPSDAPPAPETPQYRDCTEDITGITDANEQLEAARQRARDFVDVTIPALGKTPAAGSILETALARHFVSPTDAQRAGIRDTYRDILKTLVVRNYICNRQNI